MRYTLAKGVVKDTQTKITQLTMVFILAVTSLTGILPLFTTHHVSAATPNVNFTNVTLTNAELANWHSDRTAPSGGSGSVTPFDGRTALELNIDNTKASSDAFYQTEGLQRTIPASDAIKADLYVDSVWANKDVRAGLWGVGTDTSGAVQAYPIVEYANLAGAAGWRIYNSMNNTWTSVSAPVNTNGWNTLEMSLDKATNAYDVYINGTTAGSSPVDVATQLTQVILNDKNFGTTAANNYSVHWSNFAYGNVLPTPTVTAGDFDTWDASAQGFKGINVGFNANDFTDISDITVTLLKNGTPIVTNTAAPAFLSMINGGHWSSLSSPFVVSGTLTDTSCAGGPCWNAGNHVWLHSEKPDTALITVTQGGTAYTLSETNFSEATASYDSLIAPDITPPTIDNETVTNSALWGANYNILGNTHHLSEATHLPVVGGTIQVGGTFSDDRLLTNIIAYLPGRGFFGDNEFTPTPVNNGTWLPVAAGHYTVTWDTKAGAAWRTVPDGNYDFSFNARDGGNGQNGTQNNSYKTISLTIDNTGPAVAFTSPSPAENAIVHGTITVAGKFTDANGLMNTDIGVHTDGRTGEGWKCHTDWPTQGTKICTIDTAQLADGTYKLTMAGRDKAGNVTQVFRTIVIDNTAPVAVITAPHNGDSVRGTVTISGTVTDANPDHYYFVVKDSHGTVEAGPGTVNQATVSSWNWNTKALADGVYTIDLEARDKAGNKDSNSTTTISVVVDNTAPVVSDNFTPTMLTGDKKTLSPVVSGEANVTYKWTVSDAKLLNDPQDTLNGTTLTIGPAPKGDYTVTLLVTDQAGNTTTKTYAVTISTPASTSSNSASPTSDSSVQPQAVSHAVITANNNGHVLGDSTTSNPSVTNDTASSQVKGASTTKPESVSLSANTKANAQNAKFLGLGWWWLVVLAALLASFLAFVLRRRNSAAEA